MKKNELQEKINQIEKNLANLGDVQNLIITTSSQNDKMKELIAKVQEQKEDIEIVSKKRQEFEILFDELKKIKDDIIEQQNFIEEAKEGIKKTEEKSNQINELSLEQLGIISNEKLSNSFDKVKEDLKRACGVWFKWLFGTSIVLLLAIILIVFWQTIIGDTIFEISFLVKLALTSPIIFFEFFINKEYSRSKKLMEEYEFKSSIARSLEAYKEIIENLFIDKEDDEYKKKLTFILSSIEQLYSSPMKNIKEHEIGDIKIGKNGAPILSDIKDMISDVKDIVSKV